MSIIPKMVNPLGAYWQQPNHDDFVFCSPEDVFVMSESTLGLLKEYSRSVPSGVYEGKMWKSWTGTNWQLCWYDRLDPKDNNYMLIGRKDIALT